ncbi:MAG: hypothetical protein R6U31_05800, partial [bacterium]
MKKGFLKVMCLISIILISISIMGLEGGISEGKSSLIRKFDNTDIYTITNNAIDGTMGNDKGTISWGAAGNVVTLIDMFEVTGNKYYLDKAYEYIDRIVQLRDDNRGVISYLDVDANAVTKPLWRNLAYSRYYIGELPKEDPRIWEDSLFVSRYDKDGNIQYPDTSDAYWANVQIVQTGNILRCLLRFAEIMDKYDLWDDYPLLRESYLNDIKSSIEAYDVQWFEFPSEIGGFGNNYFNYGWRDNDKLSLSPSNNNEKVFERLQYHARDQKNYPVHNNHFTSMGSSLLMMYELTEDSSYLIKVKELLTSFKMGLGIDNNNSYHWNYAFSKPDSGREEDISHARLSTLFLYKCFHSEKVDLDSINSEDMEKLANMFMRNMFEGDIDHYEWVVVPDTFTIDTTIYSWELILKDGIYDMSGFVDGTSADSAQSYNNGYCYYTGWANASAVFYIPLCRYDPRIYEVAYNICSDENYRGLKNLLYYYDDYVPCTVTSNPDSITCNKTEDVEIVFSNIKILGDLAVKIVHDNQVIIDTLFQYPTNSDPDSINLSLDGFRTDKTKPLIIEYYSDNEGIKGPMRSHEIPVKGKRLYVEHMEEIPVLKYTNVEFLVKGTNVNLNDTLKYPPVAVPGCTIDIEYADGSINRGITDENGKWVFANEEIDSFVSIGAASGILGVASAC